MAFGMWFAAALLALALAVVCVWTGHLILAGLIGTAVFIVGARVLFPWFVRPMPFNF